MINLKTLILEHLNIPDRQIVLESAYHVEQLHLNIKNMVNTVKDRSKIMKIVKNPVIRKTIIKYCKEFGVNHRKFDNKFLIEILSDFLVCLLHYFEDEDDFGSDLLSIDKDFFDFDKDVRSSKSRYDEKDFLRYFNDIDKIMKHDGHDEHETYIGFIVFKYLYYTVTRQKWPYDLEVGGKKGRFDIFNKISGILDRF